MTSKLAAALYLDGVDISPDDIETLIGTLDGRHGWQLVPVKPTEAMLQRVEPALDDLYEGAKADPGYDQGGLYVYRAMLAAAPDPLAEDKP